MSVLAPKIYVINEWQRLIELNTTGTREKFVVLSPEGFSYYFKASLHKEVDGKIKDFPTEFWSEIIASQLGDLLNLPVLRYDVAIYKDILGCISMNMAAPDEEIREGKHFLTAINPNFTLDKNFKTQHSLSLIEKCLANIGIEKFRRLTIEMLLFDCIIGNSDRHSENWALIKSNNKERLDNILSKKLTFREKICYLFNKELRYNWNDFSKQRKEIFDYFKELGLSRKSAIRLVHENTYRFAPLYDNGSSLGREIPEEKIVEMLDENSSRFTKYFNKGYPDIRVTDNKITFNDTIIFLLEHYPKECAHFISRHLDRYNKDVFSTLITNIDASLPPTGFDKFRLSEHRKKFIVKIIDSRINHLYSNIPIL